MHPLALITILTFLVTLGFILWRPRNVNEAIPATIGALIIILCGTVTVSNLIEITQTISDAAITIISTIVMAIVLESFGFFNWVAEKLAEAAKGSGIRLFWYVNLLCFLMTLLFNNDGSILITTPILIMLLNNMGLKNHQKIPYLLSGGLIATASSAPIGVSNIVNLIALKIVDMSLYSQAAMMFVPSTLGLLLLVGLLFVYFKKSLPKTVPMKVTGMSLSSYHPIKQNSLQKTKKNRDKFMRNVLLFVIVVRASLFLASYLSIPLSVMAVLGSLVLLCWRWAYLKIPPTDMIKKIPWYIIVFAFSMYVLIFGLTNIGLTEWLIATMSPMVKGSLLNTSVLMGVLLSILSNIFNNHPALMVGTITLTNMGLDPLSLKVAYLANVIGSDIGALLLPMGTLATLMWMHILKKGKIKFSWWQYIKVTLVVIPPTVLFTLVILYYWVTWLF
ncbi:MULTISPECIES: arsenic transporter [Lysinibacillus]|uniref:Arsenic transporter n=1 Tax=Lysinibacillus antri TaxID=2498145 RepID=A0A432LG21_9BACI|nr:MULTISPECIES: arsenic transporter [Lysinibacillus]RUL56869.1 arsenic transporter [Lysinibacillus antri]TSI08642.1 arsenic transporter [Lysinibacillus sp. BW-2-10]